MCFWWGQMTGWARGWRKSQNMYTEKDIPLETEGIPEPKGAPPNVDPQDRGPGIPTP